MDVPEKIGKYEVLTKVGQGTFATVYKCRHPFLERTLAVKVCTSEDDTLRKRFSREAEIVADLDHPAIVRVFDYGVSEIGPYLVQEFLDGEDLRAKISARDPVSFQRRVGYLREVAEGLAYAHTRGVVHRDIKPANIRILENDSAKIMDFGIAKLSHAEERLTKAGAILGTAGYLPPEQVLGRPADQRADVFSFGALAYHLITYERPFPGKNVKELLRQVLRAEPEPITAYWPGCPQELIDVIGRCLKKEPKDRYPGFEEVLSDLEGVVRKLTPFEGGRADTPAPQARTPSRSASNTDDRGTIPLDAGPNKLGERWMRAVGGVVGRLPLERLQSLWSPRVVIAAAAVLAVIALGWWSLGRRSVAEDLIDTLAQAPLSTSVPVDALPSAGSQLVISAVPWGEVVRVLDSQGAEMALPIDRATPLILPVVAGRYQVEIENPYADERRFCYPQVGESSSEPCEVQFFEIDSLAYFKEAGWWP